MQRQLIQRKQQANGSNKHPKMPQQQRPSSLRMQMRKGLQLLQQRNGLQRRKEFPHRPIVGAHETELARGRAALVGADGGGAHRHTPCGVTRPRDLRLSTQ